MYFRKKEIDVIQLVYSSDVRVCVCLVCVCVFCMVVESTGKLLKL